jgi:hypothetical protein
MNPFRSEAEAYRFLLLTIGYFAAIVLASLLGGPWAGVPVFAVLTVAALWWFLRQRAAAPVAKTAPVARGAENERRILVVANETVGGERLLECVRSRAEGVREEVLVVCPALNTPLRHWVSDEGPARAAAGERLEASLARLREWGVAARGEIGDAEPLQAIDDAVRTFGPDEIVISTHPEGRSQWLEKRVVERARERYDVPITHIVTDLAAEEVR